MKRFLSVAINQYNISPLRGCVNDSTNMAKLFQEHGYECTTLLDNQATKQNIITALKTLTADLTEADTFVFHYSGHGSQVPCLASDEIDNLTEILCPYDLINTDGSWTTNFITDDELCAILGNIPAHVECFLDCCHSGTATRDIRPNVINRYIQSPTDQVLKHTPFNVVRGSNIISWSGCMDIQTSADAYIDNTFQGAFTAALLSCDLTQPRKQTYDNILKYMSKYGFTQIPQFTAPDDISTQAIF
jgi:hypothetical protein